MLLLTSASALLQLIKPILNFEPEVLDPQPVTMEQQSHVSQTNSTNYQND